jgi:predicted transcriptional regulator
MARKKQPPISDEDREIVGGLLRETRRAAGYRSVEAAAAQEACPSSRQTIYAYERGGLVPSLPQFLELIEFYVLVAPVAATMRPQRELRMHGVVAVTRALALEAYHVPEALALIASMQPDPRKAS